MASEQKRIFSSYQWPRATWRSRVDVLAAGLSAPQQVRALLTAAKAYPLLVLDGFERTSMLAAAVIARWRHPPRVLILDSTWKVGTSRLDRVATNLAVRSLDGPHVTYGLLSRFEVGAFPETWGIDPRRARFIPWHYDLSDEELDAPVGSDGSFFAGGDSLRDYATLVAAASRVTAPVVVASRALPADLVRHLPANVTAGPLSRADYDRRLRSASAVVLPLEVRRDRSSGQGTMLNAMAHGKVLIVNDAPGVDDYVQPDETGIVVRSGDADALAGAMRWVIEHPDQASGIGCAAREKVRATFGPENYVSRVLDLATELLAAPAGTPGPGR